MSQSDYKKMSDSEQKKEDWMNAKWRPMMGWMYMVVCFFDFVIAPILWSIVQALYKGGINVQWQPLTLQGAGLFHIAMGAVLGIAAYGRTQEKLGGANNGGAQLPEATPVQVQQPVMMSQPVMAAPAPSYAPPPAPVPSAPPADQLTMKAGKKAPQQPDFPEI